MKTRMEPRARDEPVDHVEHGLRALDETRIADEVEHGRLIVVVDGRRDEIEDRCKADLVSLALRRTGRREDEWARREQMRWLGDCEPTWRSELKVVDQKETRGQKGLCSRLVHVEEDENLRYGTLMTEALPSVRLTRWQECCRFDSLLALVEAVIVHDMVQLRAVGM